MLRNVLDSRLIATHIVFVFLKRTSPGSMARPTRTSVSSESISTPKGPRHKVSVLLGRLEPGPRDHWLALAHKLETALVGSIILGARPRRPSSSSSGFARKPRTPGSGRRQAERTSSGSASIWSPRPMLGRPERSTSGIRCGSASASDQVWRTPALTEATCKLTEAMVLNRLIRPASEARHAGLDGAYGDRDILGLQTRQLSDTALYATWIGFIRSGPWLIRPLAARERSLFQLDDTIWLYDLTSTYFEGACPVNPQAERGYRETTARTANRSWWGWWSTAMASLSRTRSSTEAGTDKTTVDAMLEKLEGRRATRGPATVVVDRGMAFDENLAQIKARHHHYLVATRQGERLECVEDFLDPAGWEEVIRESSPTNPFQKKSPGVDQEEGRGRRASRSLSQRGTP